MSATDLTFLELQDEALHDDFNANKYRGRVKGFLNDWLGEIFRTTTLAQADQSTSLAFTAGNKAAPLPATSLRVQSLRDTTSNPDRELVELGQEEFDELPDSTGDPVFFVLRAGSVDVWPTPGRDLSLELRYRGDAVDMVADDDKPALANDYRRALAYHARSELFLLEDDAEMSAVWEARRDARTRALRADLQRRSRRVRRVPSMWAGHRLPRPPIPRS